MSAAWEWRVFWRANHEEPLGPMADRLARQLGLEPPGELHEEKDTYIILPRLGHNLKLRSGALEIKWLVTQTPDGLSLWEDKQIWNFPISTASLQILATALTDRPSFRAEDGVTSQQLVGALRRECPDVELVSVPKQRIRILGGPARLELAILELPGVSRWFSVCVDGYDYSAVRDLAERYPTRPGCRSISYIDLLQEAVWWFPGRPRGEAVTSGHNAP